MAGRARVAVTFVPYYVQTLHVLGDRYGVGGGAARGRTFSGEPVWKDALHFVAPGAAHVNWFTVLAPSGSSRSLARGAGACSSSACSRLLAPVVFFSVVPATGDSALFFDRYMIPSTPGVSRARPRRRACDRAAGRAVPPRRFAIAVGGCWPWSCATPAHRDRTEAIASPRRRRRRRRLGRRHRPVRLDGDERRALLVVRLRPPANLLDQYVSLRVGVAAARRRRLVRARGAVRARRSDAPLRRLALLRGVSGRGARGRGRFRRTRAPVVRPGRGYFLVRSPRRLTPAA